MTYETLYQFSTSKSATAPTSRSLLAVCSVATATALLYRFQARKDAAKYRNELKEATVRIEELEATVLALRRMVRALQVEDPDKQQKRPSGTKGDVENFTSVISEMKGKLPSNPRAYTNYTKIVKERMQKKAAASVGKLIVLKVLGFVKH